MKIMMIESDNFFAEQILIMSSYVLSDTMNTRKAIHYAGENYFSRFSDEAYWVDGSGLSRYNQFTPFSIAQVLNMIYTDYGKDYISGIFPIGGISGTMKENFPELRPFVIAKTGSMSHVYNLSGYIITDRGRWLIFSFMNNNFIRSAGEIRKEITKILFSVKTKY
jgi:D-alanyl-D-alanine carboxypeptidase/D-alanyl-D-alanine-endopeptidase (penicillin-binding protein 4)